MTVIDLFYRRHQIFQGHMEDQTDPLTDERHLLLYGFDFAHSGFPGTFSVLLKNKTRMSGSVVPKSFHTTEHKVICFTLIAENEHKQIKNFTVEIQPSGAFTITQTHT